MALNRFRDRLLALTGGPATLNTLDLYFRYLGSLGYTGTLLDRIGRFARVNNISPTQVKNFISGAFTPQSLYATGELGAWYDPVDITTLSQDTAGTTPVTATGQNVLRMADKSGRGNHATNASGSNYLVYRVDGDGVGFLEPTTGAEFLDVPAAAIGTSGNVDVVGVTRYITAGNFSMFLAPTGAETGYALGLSNGTAMATRPISTGAAIVGGGGFPVALALATKYMVTGLLRQSRTTLAMGISNAGTASCSALAAGASWTATGYRIGAYAGFDSRNAFYGAVIRKTGLTIAQRESLQGYYASRAVSSFPSTGLMLGDSNTAAHAGQNETGFYLSSTTQKQTVARPGDTITAQDTQFSAEGRYGLARWVMIQIGLNDLVPAEAASVAIARIQVLVNTVANRTNAPVFISQMTPCRQRLIDVYGAIDGPISYQKWLDMNIAINNAGPNPITGVAGRATAHVATLNDGSGNLAAPYDTGDGIHTNNAARLINANSWRDTITAAGVVV